MRNALDHSYRDRHLIDIIDRSTFTPRFYVKNMPKNQKPSNFELKCYQVVFLFLDRFLLQPKGFNMTINFIAKNNQILIKK